MRGGGVAGESQGIPVVALVRDHSDTGFWHCGRLFAQLQMPSLQNLKEFLVTPPPFTPNIFLLPPIIQKKRKYDYMFTLTVLNVGCQNIHLDTLRAGFCGKVEITQSWNVLCYFKF